MEETWLAIGSAIWFGILTAISPCPLATNIVAVSFIARRVDNPKAAVATGGYGQAHRSCPQRSQRPRFDDPSRSTLPQRVQREGAAQPRQGKHRHDRKHRHLFGIPGDHPD